MRFRSAAAILAIPLAAGCTSTATPPPAVPAPATLSAAVDSLLQSPPFRRAHWGVLAVDAATGEPLLGLNADKLFITASNMKLVTVAAALGLLGPDYRFSTEVIAPRVHAGVADRLVVRGGGDPTFSTAFHERARAPLDSLADSLAARGLRRVAGPIVVDASRFERTLVHPAWEASDLDWYYAAPVAPFAIAEGAIPVVVRAREPGQPAAVEVLEIADLLGIDAAIATVEGARGWSDDLHRHPGTDSLILRGTVGAEAGADTSWIAQVDPGRLAGRALGQALVTAGVAVDGPVIVMAGSDSTAAEASAGEPGERVVWRSPPLRDILHLPLTESDNWVSEQLLKTLGAEVRGQGSWSAGTAVADSFMVAVVGADSGSLYMRDGSGLTAQDLVTPAALVALLRWVDDQPWGPKYRAALATPGASGGTLEDRLLEHRGRVAAKTGTIRHVNALSGYATRTDGREIVFSILSNASGQPSSAVRPTLDRIVELLLHGGKEP